MITGGTGFIGKRLYGALNDRGHEITVLTRNLETAQAALGSDVRGLVWNPASHTELVPLPGGTDAIVNLAGESIANGRWTEARKASIRTSRTQVTRAIVGGMRSASTPPSILINASAIGFYGQRGDELLTEQATPGHGFLTDVAVEWERCAHDAEALGVRVALMRLGIVLGRDGGALPRMALPFKLFAGGPIGNGQQWMSWIHVDDVVGMIIWALENDAVTGPINTVAPEPLKNAEFSQELGRAISRPSWLPAPGFALKILLGEMADALLLHGQRVIPARALELGYSFQYPTARAALEAALS
ncbi:MAG: TIGR01777 family oxidoreductase [Chloroflexota bacterium]